MQISSTMDYQKHCLVLNVFIIKKAALILDFCLFGNIRHNFVVPKIIESAPKTFMPIQIPDLHRVAMMRATAVAAPNFQLGSILMNLCEP